MNIVRKSINAGFLGASLCKSLYVGVQYKRGLLNIDGALAYRPYFRDETVDTLRNLCSKLCSNLPSTFFG